MPSQPVTSGRRSTPQTVAKGLFNITHKIDSGSFGDVFAGVDVRTGTDVAVKIERSRASSADTEREVAIMQLLNKQRRHQGFARFYHFGLEGRRNCIVMERLGMSLLDLSRARGGVFSAKTAALVAEQALGCLEVLHSCGIVHRDIKPENFMCGIGPRRHHLYLIDFGMAAEYYSKGRHAPLEVVKGFTGNLRYASINSHLFYRQSRRDDLEALGHMLLFLVRGSLPWSGIPARGWEEQNRRVMQKKQSTDVADLCAGHPAAFREYLLHTRNLGYSSRPDYQMLTGLFTEVRDTIARKEEAPVQDHDVEWMLPKDRAQSVALQSRVLVAQPDDARSHNLFRGLLCGAKCVALQQRPGPPNPLMTMVAA